MGIHSPCLAALFFPIRCFVVCSVFEKWLVFFGVRISFTGLSKNYLIPPADTLAPGTTVSKNSKRIIRCLGVGSSGFVFCFCFVCNWAVQIHILPRNPVEDFIVPGLRRNPEIWGSHCTADGPSSCLTAAGTSFSTQTNFVPRWRMRTTQTARRHPPFITTTTPLSARGRPLEGRGLFWFSLHPPTGRGRGGGGRKISDISQPLGTERVT